MVNFDRFKEAIEALSLAEVEHEGFAEYRQKIEGLKLKAEITKRETGIDPKLVDENSQEFKVANAAEKRYKFYVEETAGQIKGSLDEIVAGAEPSKLVQALRFVPAKSEKYKDLAGLIADYQMYANLKAPVGKDEDDARRNAEEAGKKFEGKLVKVIQAEMMKKGVSEKKAEVNAKYLALIAGKEYLSGVINSETKRVVGELESAGTGTIAEYLKDVLKDDKAYVAFGKALYNLHRKKDEKKPNIVQMPMRDLKMAEAA